MALPPWVESQVLTDKRITDPLQHLINQHHRRRDVQHRAPFIPVQRRNLEQGPEEGHVENHEMQRHAECNGRYEVHVAPYRQGQEGFVFRQRVARVKHFNDDEDRE